MIRKIVKHVLLDILRGRVALCYTAFLFLATAGLFNMDADTGKSLTSILSVVLMLVPLTCLIFATIHYYNSYEFIELLSTQPLRRNVILMGEYLGVSIALTIALLVGTGLPVAAYDRSVTGGFILLAGVLLTFVFVALAFLGAVCSRDKARGMGVAMLQWFFFALLYDGLLLLILFSFQDYPLEKAVIGLVALNPIDLARTFVMLQMDVSALLGMTGAVMQEFFGSSLGMAYALGVLLLWIIAPLWLALRIFRKKDL
ncbi:MAG: ABC transporter permease subunit [Verrucomicrobiaceae bacterium]